MKKKPESGKYAECTTWQEDLTDGLISQYTLFRKMK